LFCFFRLSDKTTENRFGKFFPEPYIGVCDHPLYSFYFLLFKEQIKEVGKKTIESRLKRTTGI
jgi:hypothetical protein